MKLILQFTNEFVSVSLKSVLHECNFKSFFKNGVIVFGYNCTVLYVSYEVMFFYEPNVETTGHVMLKLMVDINYGLYE